MNGIADAAAAWTARFARTLKNCRLYEAGNPAVLRLREELATSLAQLLDEHGTLTLRCTSSDILCGETSLYPARSREDNLGMVFFRDGIRAVVFSPGIPPGEVDAFLDAVLRVTGRAADDEDLVTLLWESNLRFDRGSLLLQNEDINLVAFDNDSVGVWDDPLHLVGDYGHLRYRVFAAGPVHVPRGVPVEIEAADTAASA